MDNLQALNDETFYQNVLPRLEQLETVRQSKLAVYLFRRRIAIPAAIVLTPVCTCLDYMLIYWQRGNDNGFAGVTFILLAALYAWVAAPRHQYRLAYKKGILPKIAKLFGDLDYRADGKIPMAAMESSKIIPKHHRYKSEDYFFGTYKDVQINLAEIRLEERIPAGKKHAYRTVFKGLAILINLPRKKFYGHTVLMQDISTLEKWFKRQIADLQRADLVDPEFEKLFDVFTNDQVEARYLIDPGMIENLKDMRDMYDAKNFSAAYYENQVLVLLPSKHKYFEPAHIKIKATDPPSVIRMKKELGLILDLVDKLEIYDASSIHKSQL